MKRKIKKRIISSVMYVHLLVCTLWCILTSLHHHRRSDSMVGSPADDTNTIFETEHFRLQLVFYVWMSNEIKIKKYNNNTIQYVIVIAIHFHNIYNMWILWYMRQFTRHRWHITIVYVKVLMPHAMHMHILRVVAASVVVRCLFTTLCLWCLHQPRALK